MGLYRAVVFFMTGGMLILHVLEWKAAVSVVPSLRSGSAPGSHGLRTALRLEALYYLVAFPLLYAFSNSLLGRFMVLSAIYHWVGLALFEASGLWRGAGMRRRSSAAGRKEICAIALIDLGELILLTAFCKTLFNVTFLMRSIT